MENEERVMEKARGKHGKVCMNSQLERIQK